MTTYAVTAASGQLGGEIVKALREEVGADQVIGLARTPKNAESLGVEIRPGDYKAADDLQASLKGVDALVLVSGMDAPDKRIAQHRNVIEAAKKTGVTRLVYTSIQGASEGTTFSPIVQSNRQTEEDVRQSGLEWVIGRNGLYIEPDVEYMESYKQRGEVANCAGDGLCGYTTRRELGVAYARMLTGAQHLGQRYNLHGKAITQRELTGYLNQTFGSSLNYRELSVDEYRAERVAELGEFIGTIIAGIYQGIRQGALNQESHFEKAAGRPHISWDDYFAQLSPLN